jgi:endonuclease YncB( thermonuclease family)
LRIFLIILLLLISTPSYAKEQATDGRSPSELKPLICTEKHHEGCLRYVPPTARPGKLEPLNLERVIDGDTLVASGRKIRLWGINAPEKGTPYYKIATMFLEAVLKDGKLECKFLEKDRYQRDVMHCWIDKADLGAMIIEAGLAIDYERYSGGFYYYEERLAKLKKRGMWKHSKYTIGKD